MADASRTVTDELMQNAAQYPPRYVEGTHSPRPRRGIAVVACMDARLDLFAMLGLHPGDCHVIRNAGGVYTEDIVRSLVVSQRALGTTEVILIQHTDCGLEKLNEESFFADVKADIGDVPHWRLHDFDDVELNVKQSVEALRNDKFLPNRDSIRGFVFDTTTGILNEVL